MRLGQRLSNAYYEITGMNLPDDIDPYYLDERVDSFWVYVHSNHDSMTAMNIASVACKDWYRG